MNSNLPMVGTPEWRKRYIAVAETSGNPLYSQIDLNPGLESFFMGEADLFSQRMSSLKKDVPKVSDEIERYKGFIADPIYAGLVFESLVVPNLSAVVKIKG